MTDIADAIGVSRATVSLVLRAARWSMSTPARGWRPNCAGSAMYNRGAANLRRRTSTSVALVINDLSNPFFAEFASGVDEAPARRAT